MSDNERLDRFPGDPPISTDRLLEAAGRRHPIDAERAARVRRAVHATWRREIRQPRRYRLMVWAAAATVALASVAIFMLSTRRVHLPEPAAFATVTRVSGPVVERAESLRVLGVGTKVFRGGTIETPPRGGVALELGDGTAVRLDESTRVTLSGSSEIELAAGRIYVDTGNGGAGHGAIGVVTQLGRVDDIGTQFEVSCRPESLAVRVREGSVRLSAPHGNWPVGRGQRGELSSSGEFKATALAASGEDWSWMTQLITPFDLEGRTLQQFLAWVGRETGRKVVYDSPATEQAAATTTLHGKLSDSDPQQALRLVLATTSLQVTTDETTLRVREGS